MQVCSSIGGMHFRDLPQNKRTDVKLCFYRIVEEISAIQDFMLDSCIVLITERRDQREKKFQ